MQASTRRFPEWIRRQWPSGEAHQEVKVLLEGLNLNTVCQSAHCPNQGECWSRRTATFLVLGNICTRNCAFCGVTHGQPLPLDENEPENVAEAVRRLGARHAVITSVTRDDLADGGAGAIARTVTAVKERNGGTTVEVLVPDFCGDADAISSVIASGPEIFGHNIETVERLHPQLRDRRYGYIRSLEVLRVARGLRADGFVKSALMLGCGESESDVLGTLKDLRDAGCDAVAMGQYLRPGPGNGPVVEYVTPEQFKAYESAAYEMGFVFAVAGPLVRSSYRAADLLAAIPTGK
jgi:lipoic acid synthetase